MVRSVRSMRRLLAVLPLLALLLAGCGGGGGDGSAADGTVRWGDGEYGVVLAHGAAFDAKSWDTQARAIADVGATVVAVEDISPDSIAAAVRGLKKEGHDRVALVGGSAGSDAILRLSSEQPDLADQLVLLSPNTVVDGLGEQPKLFIASTGEPVADVSRELTTQSPGDDNRALLLPGSAHAQNIFDSDQGPRALAAILDRIERRAG